ncbi:MAG: tetratricopeptide repeat protein [Planctomycetales bacterium]|nr:tetratricopeptide repeat protein [bacterium]UNM07426.1 MAG: tetratricopeptide repeat protein [Planctomycetales bacterium]
MLVLPAGCSKGKPASPPDPAVLLATLRESGLEGDGEVIERIAARMIDRDLQAISFHKLREEEWTGIFRELRELEETQPSTMGSYLLALACWQRSLDGNDEDGQEAASIANRLAEELPDCAPLCQLRASIAYQRNDDHVQAEQLALRAGQLDPDNPGPMVFLAGMYIDQDRSRKARSYALSALEIDPDNAEACSLMSRICYDESEYEEALDWARRAIRLDDRLSGAHVNLGRVHDYWEQDDLAESEYLRAIEINPRNSVAYNNLALMYKWMDRFDDSRRCYEKAIELGPRRPVPHSNMSYLLHDLKEFDAAREQMLTALELRDDPDDRAFLNSLYVLFSEMELNHGASTKEKPADPTGPYHVMQLIRTDRYDDLSDDAESRLLERIEAKPGDPYPHHCLARLYAWQGRRADAEREFSLSLEMDEMFAPAYDDLGRMYMQQGVDGKAIDMINHALSFHHDNTELRMLLAELHERTGDLQNALQQYQQAVLRPVVDGELYYRYARLLERLDRPEEALACYEQYLAFDEDELLAHAGEAHSALDRLNGLH